jgi:hypothetical protein
MLDPELVLRQDQLGPLAGLAGLSHLGINLAPADGGLHAAPELSGLQRLAALRHLELCTALSMLALQQLAALTQLTRLDLVVRAMQVGGVGWVVVGEGAGLGPGCRLAGTCWHEGPETALTVRGMHAAAAPPLPCRPPDGH